MGRFSTAGDDCHWPVSGANLQLQWGTAFALWTVPLIMEMLGIGERRLQAGRHALTLALVMFIVLQAALMTESYLTSSSGAWPLHHNRDFPSHQLADTIGPAARAEIGGPIRIISGDQRTAGAIALWLPEHPLVLIDGNLKRSPWVLPETIEHEPILELWGPNTGPENAKTTVLGWRWNILWPRSRRQ